MCVQVNLNQENMAALQAPHGKTLADLVAMEVGNIGENMAVRRGVFLQVPEGQQIGSYVHTAGKIMALVQYKGLLSQ